MKKHAFINMTHGRDPDQKKRMAQAQAEGVCPFCCNQLVRFHPKPIEREGRFWVITKNAFPYEGARVHYLAIYKPKHISHIHELPKQAAAELIELFAWLSHTKKVRGGAIIMRYGETAYNGSSINHLHAHLVSGNTSVAAPEHARGDLRVKIGYKKKSSS